MKWAYLVNLSKMTQNKFFLVGVKGNSLKNPWSLSLIPIAEFKSAAITPTETDQL